MNILLCGADGFIGRALEQALIASGHTVRRAVRRPSRPGDVAVNFRHDVEPAAWLPRLDGCAAVINAVGILREVQPGDFERIHHRSPAALFAACAEAGVARVIQVSALGAQSERTGYLASKAAADRALLAALPGGVVLRPGLVFGEQGASSQLFLALASLPLVGLPGGGKQRLRPIHIDDLCAMVVALLAEQPAERVIEAVGGEELDYAQLLACYRRSLGFAAGGDICLAGDADESRVACGGTIPRLAADAGNLGHAARRQHRRGRRHGSPAGPLAACAARIHRARARSGTARGDAGALAWRLAARRSRRGLDGLRRGVAGRAVNLSRTHG